MKRVTIIDYGMGNLRSLAKAFEAVGAQVLVTGERKAIAAAPKLVLPGVGAFGQAMENLRRSGVAEVLREKVLSGTPVLGVCLGMQLLLERSEEFGEHQGLGFVPGTVSPFPRTLRVPHMGWNRVKKQREDPLLAGVLDNAFFYFAHSFYPRPRDDAVTLGTTDYGIIYTSVLRWGNLWGVQFHPEKSQRWGLKILENFVCWPIESSPASM